MRMVLFLTDGYIGNEAEIFELVDREIGDARLFSLGVGEAPNRYLLDGLAAAGHGAVTYAGGGENIDSVVDRFYDRITAPVLTDLEIDWGGLAVSQVLPAELPDLFAGQPLTVFGRYQGEPAGAIEVRAKAKTAALALPVGFDIAEASDVQGVSSVWARYEVDRLLGHPTPADEGNIDEAAKQAVIELALEHRLLTQFTSFVAVEERTLIGVTGEPWTIQQPLELPLGTSYAGFDSDAAEDTIGLATTRREGSSAVAFGDRVARVPQVHQGETLYGALDKDILRRIFRAQLKELRACYEHALVKDPNLRGRMSLTISVDAKGKVVSVEITEDQLGHDVGKCMVKVVEEWTFPSGGPLVFSYPFNFEPPELK